MRKYCFTYDALDSDEWKPDELRSLIASILIAHSAINLVSPAASTILFEDVATINRISYWNNVINMQVYEDIYYYLCLVGKDVNGEYIEKIDPDNDLNSNFQELVLMLIENLN